MREFIGLICSSLLLTGTGCGMKPTGTAEAPANNETVILSNVQSDSTEEGIVPVEAIDPSADTTLEIPSTDSTSDVPPDSIEEQTTSMHRIFADDKIALTSFSDGKHFTLAGNPGAVNPILLPVEINNVCMTLNCSPATSACEITCQNLGSDGSFSFIFGASGGDVASVFLMEHLPVGFNLTTKTIPTGAPSPSDVSPLPNPSPEL